MALVAASLDILGGQGVQARFLVDHLRTEGCDVTFVPIDSRFPRGLGWLRRWPYVRTALNMVLYLPSLSRLRRADVVHVFSASYWSFLLAPVPAMLAARALGRRVVLHYHSGEAEDHLRRWGAGVHPWLRLAHVIVVPSEYLRGVFAQHGHTTLVIPNVLDLSRFRYRERGSLAPRLLSVRNLDPYYGIDDVLRAFARVRSRHPEASLTVAGCGSQERALRRMAASLGGGIRFIGRVEPHEMPALYDAHDVFVNASVVDNQPVSILEAFAAGIPVVTTPTGDIASMVQDGEAGLLVPPREPGAMAEAVERLLAAPDQARRIARRARREVERHTWPRVRDRWEAIYSRDYGESKGVAS